MQATGAIVESRPGKRFGWRTTTRITVDAERQGSHVPVATGESIFLYMEREPTKQDRNVALTSSWSGDGTSVADIPEEDLMRGFGDDSSGESLP